MIRTHPLPLGFAVTWGSRYTNFLILGHVHPPGTSEAYMAMSAGPHREGLPPEMEYLSGRTQDVHIPTSERPIVWSHRLGKWVDPTRYRFMPGDKVRGTRTGREYLVLDYDGQPSTGQTSTAYHAFSALDKRAYQPNEDRLEPLLLVGTSGVHQDDEEADLS